MSALTAFILSVFIVGISLLIAIGSVVVLKAIGVTI